MHTFLQVGRSVSGACAARAMTENLEYLTSNHLPYSANYLLDENSNKTAL